MSLFKEEKGLILINLSGVAGGVRREDWGGQHTAALIPSLWAEIPWDGERRVSRQGECEHPFAVWRETARSTGKQVFGGQEDKAPARQMQTRVPKPGNGGVGSSPPEKRHLSGGSRAARTAAGKPPASRGRVAANG